MTGDRPARLWNAAVVLVVVVALVWTFVRIFTSPVDPGVAAPMRVANFFSYFTILSNILVGIAATTLVLAPDRDGRWWRALRLDAVLCITVTAVVHLVALRPLQELHGAAAVTDNLLHVVVPLLAMIGWAVFGPWPRIDRATVLRSLVVPLAWIGYTLVRGPIVDWYPYPFLDVRDLGYPRALINTAVVAILFLLLGAAAQAMERRRTPDGADVGAHP